jgi:hypothetical protein
LERETQVSKSPVPVPTGTNAGPKAGKEARVQLQDRKAFICLDIDVILFFCARCLWNFLSGLSPIPVPTMTIAISQAGKEVKVWL